jgi:ATP-dependent phosphoenolpyruvate carboxykinase
MLQGTGDDEYAYESAGVFTTEALAKAKADAINAEYDVDDFAIAYKIDEWTLNT